MGLKSRFDALDQMLVNARRAVLSHVEHIAAQHQVVDGWGDHTLGAGEATATPSVPRSGRCDEPVADPDDESLRVSCGRRHPCGIHDGATLTTVERAASERLRLEREWADQDAAINLLAVTLREMVRSADEGIRRALPMSKPVEKKLCSPEGKEGAHLPWSPGGLLAAGNGWSDPTCRRNAGPTGLCDACLLRANRWRRANNHPELGHREAAA